jgi:hypothetical protein
MHLYLLFFMVAQAEVSVKFGIELVLQTQPVNHISADPPHGAVFKADDVSLSNNLSLLLVLGIC